MRRQHVIFAILLSIVCPFVLSAQSKTISENEFNSVWRSACEKTKATSHVLTETDEKFDDEVSAPYNVYISTKKYIPPDRIWTVAGRKGGKDDDIFEEIRIGRNSFSRTGVNGVWKSQGLGFTGLYICEQLKSNGSGSGSGNATGNSDENASFRTEHRYQYLGLEKMGNRWVKRYLHTEVTTITSSDFSTESTVDHLYLVSEDGLFLQSESVAHQIGTKRWSRQLRSYDYDQKDLKIESPIKQH